MSNSELSWKLADFRANGVEPPARCVANPELSEGQMMSADEVEEFIKDSVASLRILADKHSPHLDQVTTSYRADLAYLLEVGSLSEDDYNDLTNEANLRF